MSLTYVYCIVRSARPPSLTNVPAPMPGADGVQVETAGDDRWLVVSHVPETSYGEAALARGLQDITWVGRRALAHEAVVEHFLKARAVLPMQLFTLFTSDERAVAHVRRNRRSIDRVLARVERMVEWGVRLTFDQKAVTEPATEGVRARVRPRTAETGAGYLVRKRDMRDFHRVRLANARTRGNRLYRALARTATAARRRSSTEQAAAGSGLLVDAAFLVPARGGAAFRAVLRRESRDLGDAGVAVLLTGPWPPYNFIDRAPRGRA